MGGKARLGQWVLLAVIVVTALSEFALAGHSIRAGRVNNGQIGRVLLTVWLLWRAWDGAGWARWLLAGLFLAAAGFAIFIGVSSGAVRERPEVMVLVAGMGAVYAALGVGMASPWVGAYQTARRGSPDADPVVATDRCLDSNS